MLFSLFKRSIVLPSNKISIVTIGLQTVRKRSPKVGIVEVWVNTRGL